MNVDDMGLQLALVERGVGIARVSLLLVEDSLREGRLVECCRTMRARTHPYTWCIRRCGKFQRESNCCATSCSTN
jgi:DNA-binding transcriptional LysR family regulator